MWNDGKFYYRGREEDGLHQSSGTPHVCRCGRCKKGNSGRDTTSVQSESKMDGEQERGGGDDEREGEERGAGPAEPEWASRELAALHNAVVVARER